MAIGMALGEFTYSVAIEGDKIDTLFAKLDAMEKKSVEQTKKSMAEKERVTQGFKTTLDSARKSVFAFGAAFTAGFWGVDKLISSTAQYAINIQSLASQSGIATDSLQKMANAYGLASNISTDKAQADLASLAQMINEVKLGIKDPTGMMIAGIRINAETNIDAVINDIRRRTKGMSDVKANLILKQIGLGPDFLRFIRASEDELKRFHQIPILTKEQLQSTNQAAQGINMIKKQLISFKQIAIANISPQLTKSFNEIFDGIMKNKDRIIDFLGKAIVYIKDFTIAIGNTVMFGIDLIHFITQSSNGFIWMGTAIGALMLSMRPMLLLFGALVLLADDFQVWREGGLSAFGSVYEVLSKYSNILGPIAVGFLGLISAIKILNFIGVIKSANIFITTLKTVGLLFTGLPTLAAKAAVGIAAALAPLLANPVFLGLVALGGGAYGVKKLVDHFNKDDNKGIDIKKAEYSQDLFAGRTVGTPLNPQQTFIPTTPRNQPPAMQSFTPIPRNTGGSNVTNNNTFNIDGKDGKEIASEIEKVLEKQKKQEYDSLAFSY